MKKLRIYLDTSVWNFLLADDAPEKRDVTKDFFAKINKYEIFISNVVIQEINKADNIKKGYLNKFLEKYKPFVLDETEEVKRLANLYVKKGIIPTSKYDDALHIGYSTYYNMDVLLSWNYKHLANLFKKRKISIINLGEGYDKPLEMITPMEAI